MVMPASGTMTNLRINLGTGNPREDAYLAISKDLKSTTAGFSASDFVAISTNKCGRSDYDVTMTFNSGDLVGGSTYYFYWLTESNGTYTTVQQRYCVGDQNKGVQMSIGSVGSTTAQSTEYDPRFSCEMSVKDNVYYRMRALYPDDICYLYSNSSNENKIFKIVNASTSLVTSRYVWKTTLGAKGIYIQNVGNSHYIAKINGSNDGATYLNATTIADADQFTIVENNPERNYNYSGYIALKSTTNDNSYLNCFTTNNNYVGSYNAQNNKSGQFLFQQVKKVTFSQAIRVNNNGEAVSTIYVACDGSDSFTLPADFTYTISGVDYNATDAAATIAAAGTNDINVTVKIVEDSKMYRLMQKWTSNTYYLYANTTDQNHGNRLWKSTTAPDVTNANYVWEAKSSGENWKFHNIGGERWIATASHNSNDGTGVNALSATTVDNAEAFELISANSCSYPPSDFSTVNYVALKATSRTTTTYLNSYSTANNFVGWHNAVHAGYYFKFIPVKKVTFSEAVAVNGGDAVSTIYVAADGSDSFTLPGDKLYSINGAEAVGYIEAASTIATCSSDIDVTVSESPTKNVTYILKWSDGSTIKTEENVTTNLLNPSSNFLPTSFANDFVTLSYSPAEITSETSEVVVTATWNGGPFKLSDNFASAKWYTVGIHSSYESENYIWKYDSDKLKTETVAKDAYHLLNDANCFAFFGNPYTGINIYNKSAAKYVVKAKDETQATFDATGTNFIPKASRESAKTVANGYSCFLVSDGTFYLNCHANDNFKVNGWNDNDAGSTCWFIPAGQYYLNYIDGLALEAPVGAVGTSSYFTTVANAAGAKSALTSLRSTIAGALYSDMETLATVNNQLDPVRNAGTFALTDGYYQIVSANPDFVNQTGTRRRMIFNGSAIGWSDDMNANNINGIFKLTSTEGDNAYSIYSGNGQNYLSNGGGALGASTAVTITEAASGTAQYSFYLAEGYNNNHHYLHTLGHNNGAGTSGNLTAWDAGANSASAWYIMPVNSVDLTLNDGGDGNYYATLCLPFDVTLSGCNAYTMTLSGEYLVPSEAITTVPAGTPVLLRGTTAKATAQIAATAATSAPLTSTALTGSYVPTTASEGLVGGQKVYTLGKVDDEVGFYRYMGTSIRANGAYLLLDASSQVRGFRFDFGGTDAITHVVAPTKPDAPLYDLQGRRVGNATHGIYIQNGKKILK